jgi:hypothetical protein
VGLPRTQGAGHISEHILSSKSVKMRKKGGGTVERWESPEDGIAVH